MPQMMLALPSKMFTDHLRLASDTFQTDEHAGGPEGKDVALGDRRCRSWSLASQPL